MRSARDVIPIIDMWAPLVPSSETIDHIATEFPSEQLDYLEVFSKAEISEDQFAAYAETLRRTTTRSSRISTRRASCAA
jgi:hypothetical protein